MTETITVELSSPLAAKLREHCERVGITESDMIRHLLWLQYGSDNHE